MQTTHKIKMTIINKVLPISLCPLLLTSCSVSEQPQSPEALLETTPPQSVFEETEITSEEIIETAEITEAEYVSHANQKVTFEGDTSSDEITQADFKNCQEALEADGEFVLTDDHITAFDIDYDGQNELLVIYDYFFFVLKRATEK